MVNVSTPWNVKGAKCGNNINAPDLDIGLKTFAQRRLTARSWRFARRFQKASIFSQWFKLYLKGLFRLKNDILENCKKANKIYEDYFD